jgi:hypothetical protein
LFKDRYLEANVNFFLEVDEVSDGEIFGGVHPLTGDVGGVESPLELRASIKTFVIYQLANDQRGNGSGVGCGVYDEEGANDQGGIRAAMVRYLLDFCFDPTVHAEHAVVFGDFCVRSLREVATRDFEEPTALSIETSLTQILPREDLAAFWLKHRDMLRRELLQLDREVIARNFQATYKDKLPMVFSILDTMAVPRAETHPAANTDAS